MTNFKLPRANSFMAVELEAAKHASWNTNQSQHARQQAQYKQMHIHCNTYSIRDIAQTTDMGLDRQDITIWSQTRCTQYGMQRAGLFSYVLWNMIYCQFSMQFKQIRMSLAKSSAFFDWKMYFCFACHRVAIAGVLTQRKLWISRICAVQGICTVRDSLNSTWGLSNSMESQTDKNIIKYEKWHCRGLSIMCLSCWHLYK